MSSTGSTAHATASSSTTSNHVFLLRHCVRSSMEDPYVDESGEWSTSWKDYLGYEKGVPDWNVPQNWCLGQAATDMSYDMGYSIIHDIIMKTPSSSPKNSLKKHFNFEIISDTSQRDLDTSLSMMEGIQEALDEVASRSSTTTAVTTKGLDKIWTGYGRGEGADEVTWMWSEHVCDKYYHEDVSYDEVQKTFQTARRPTTTIQDAVDLMFKVASIINDDSSTDSSNESELSSLREYDDSLMIVNDDYELEGPHYLIHEFGEMLFYAVAAGIDYGGINKNIDDDDDDSVAGRSSDRPLLLVSDVYKLLQFTYYVRRIKYVDNSWSASRGAVWARVLLHTLDKGSIMQQQSVEDEDQNGKEVVNVTIFVGHDTDISFVSTALHAEWDLPHYRPINKSMIMTPPGSGIHFMLDKSTSTVDVSYVAPVYHDIHEQEATGRWTPSFSGALTERVPVYLKKSPKVDADDSGKNFLGKLSFHQLENHISNVLARYPVSHHCYNHEAIAKIEDRVRFVSATKDSHEDRTKSFGSSTSSLAVESIIIFQSVFLLIATASAVYFRRRLLTMTSGFNRSGNRNHPDQKSNSFTDNSFSDDTNCTSGSSSSSSVFDDEGLCSTEQEDSFCSSPSLHGDNTVVVCRSNSSSNDRDTPTSHQSMKELASGVPIV